MIPYGRQSIDDADIQAVVDVLKSDFLTQGPKVPEFERRLCEYTNAKFASVSNSATSSLHLACMALGLKEGDCLWSSAITYVASVNCAFSCGADVELIDIDPQTYNICLNSLGEKLKHAAKKNALPKIIVAVHMAGQSCDMKAIREMSQAYGIKLIEDASHAIGASYAGKKVGCCEYSDISVFSFHPVKIITSAEGGAALTNCPALAEKLNLLRSHGITRDPDAMTEAPHGPWYYQQLMLGANYRMTELQAALGASQLRKIDRFVSRRAEIANEYTDAFEGLPIATPQLISDAQSAWHLYIIQLKLDEMSVTHLEVFEALRKGGLGVNLHYIPLHFQPYIRSRIRGVKQFSNAERYYGRAISLPIFPQMTNEDCDAVISLVRDVTSG